MNGAERESANCGTTAATKLGSQRQVLKKQCNKQRQVCFKRRRNFYEARCHFSFYSCGKTRAAFSQQQTLWGRAIKRLLRLAIPRIRLPRQFGSSTSQEEEFWRTSQMENQLTISRQDLGDQNLRESRDVRTCHSQPSANVHEVGLSTRTR